MKHHHDEDDDNDDIAATAATVAAIIHEHIERVQERTEADLKAIEAQHREAVTQLIDAQSQLKRAQQETAGLAAERGDLQRKLKEAIAAKAVAENAKAVAENEYEQLVATHQQLTEGLSRTLREHVRPASPTPAKRSEPAETKVSASASTSAKSTPSAVPPAASPSSAKKKPLQFPGPARDAKRVRIRQGTYLSVEGIPGQLVDLSIGGAQAVLTQMVKPNQLVRLTVPTTAGQLICRGRIVWVVYEQPGTSMSVYRTGVKFIDADGRAVEEFMRDFAEQPLGRRSAEIA